MTDETDRTSADDAIDWERVGRVATGPDGSPHWGRIRWALRGRDSRDDADLTLPLVAAASFTVFVPLLAAFVVDPLGLGPLWPAGIGLVVVLGIAATVVERLHHYYVDDADVVVEELRYRYASGALSFEEFEAKIDRVLRDGPRAVDAVPESTGGESTGSESAATSNDRPDPETVLRERYARGEIDEPEYRRRMHVLGEEVPDADVPGEDVQGEDVPGERDTEPAEFE